MRTTELGLYIHFPFCARRCAYCDFHSLPFSRKLAEPLWQAMLYHLEQLDELCKEALSRPLSSIYVGGGTPSLWPAARLNYLLERIALKFNLAAHAEITLEANPGSISRAGLNDLHAGGFNRLSLGVQSFNPQSLRVLERDHRPGQIAKTVEWARAAGFANLSLDLIYGLPFQSVNMATEDVALALALQPEHISLYQLTLSPNTRMAGLYTAYQPPMPGEDAVLLMEERAHALCDRHGFIHYEVSNYAKPGFLCIHNSSTWRGGDYLALGPGAHGHWQGVRWANYYDLPIYIDAWRPDGKPGVEFREQLTAKERAQELFMLGLRTAEGVDLERVSLLVGQAAQHVYGRGIAYVTEQGWARLNGRYLQPTATGMKMADSASLEFIA